MLLIIFSHGTVFKPMHSVGKQILYRTVEIQYSKSGSFFSFFLIFSDCSKGALLFRLLVMLKSLEQSGCAVIEHI